MEELDSNNLNTVIRTVCFECGATANVLTCLKRYGVPPLQVCFQASTYHAGVCDFCKKGKDVTGTRDFFYPDFTLIEQVKELLWKEKE